MIGVTAANILLYPCAFHKPSDSLRHSFLIVIKHPG
jgi:hypothetical protein